VQDSIEICEKPSDMLDGVRVQPRPEGETVEARVTVPANASTGETVTVEFAWVPKLTLALVGLSDMEKSVTVTVTFAVWESVPLAPTIVTV